MASEVAIMQPTMSSNPSTRASAASASASVSPPALSSFIFTASYLPTSALSVARSWTLSSAQIGTVWAMSASAPSAAAGSGWSISVTPAAPPTARVSAQISGGPAFVGIHDQLGGGRGIADCRDALRIADPAKLDLQERAGCRSGGGLRHLLGRAERNRVGGETGPSGGYPKQFVGRTVGALGFKIDEGAVEGIACRAGRKDALQGNSVQTAPG